MSDAVTGGGPESGRIRRQYLVDEGDAAVHHAELELGVGDDYPARPGVGGGFAVDGQGQFRRLPGRIAPGNTFGLLHADVLVMTAHGGLGGRREQRFGQSRGFLQTGRQSVAAQLAAGPVHFPARSGQIAAHDALDGQGNGLAGQNRPPFQLLAVGTKLGGIAVDVGFLDVVGHQVGETLHPKQRELVENNALAGNRVVQNDVKGRHTIRGDDQQGVVVDIVNIPHLAA